MNRRRVAVGVLVLLAVVWVGVGAAVFHGGVLVSDQETVVMAADTAPANGTVSAHVTVRDHDDGDPLPGTSVTVALVDDGSQRVVDSGETTAAGNYTATFQAPGEPGEYGLRVLADSEAGEDTVDLGLNVTAANGSAGAASVLVETDKPVYRPGGTIHVRPVVRSGDRGGTGNATVTVTDPRGNRLYSRPVALDAFGMGEASVPLASVARTGRYEIAVAYGEVERTRTVTVEEYDLPAFDVRFRPDRSSYRPGDTLRATVVAERFFGKPVENASVTVEGLGYVGDGERFGSTTARTDGTGLATVDLRLPAYFAPTDGNGQRGAVRLNVSVTDRSGTTETVTRRVPVTENRLLVDAVLAGETLVPGVENTVYLTTRAPDGTPVPATVEVGNRTVETDERGVGTYTFVPGESDGRRLHLRARTANATVERTAYLDYERRSRLGLVLDRRTVDVGGTVAGTVLVGGEAETVYLDLVGGGQTLATRALPVEDGRANLSIRVPRSALGTPALRAWTVFRDGTVRSAARRLVVSPATATNVTVATGEGPYRPGENATLTVRTRRDGDPVAAAVGVDVVDESVFAVEASSPGLARLRQGLDDAPVGPVFGANLSVPEPTTGGETANSYTRKQARLASQQQSLREVNGGLFGLLLAGLPLGFVVLQGRRTDTRAFLGRLASLAGLAAVLAVALALVSLLAVALLSVFGVLLVFLVVLFGAPVGLLVWLLVAGFEREEQGYREAATVVVAVVVLGLVGLLLGDYVALDSIGQGWLVVGAAGLLAMLAAPAGAGDSPGSAESTLRPTVVVVAVVALVVVASVLAPAGLAGFAAMGAAGGDATPEAAGNGNGNGGNGDAGGRVDEAAGNGAGANATGGGGSAVRQYFPETAASRIVRTGSDGRANVSLTMPDSITTWRVSSLAAPRRGGLGSDRSSVRVFQPFFVEPDVPQSVTQNDTVAVPVRVFNYRNRSANVTVDLRAAAWFDAGDRTRQVALGPNEAASVRFEVTARANGEHDLTVVATARRPGGNRTTDAVRKTVSVDPYGRQRTVARSGRLSGTVRTNVTVPENAVPGSPRTVLRVYPGAFGQVVGGMNALLSKPTGCFEQTSASLYPNVLALRYMERTGTDSPEVRARAERFIASGYQRLLTFETSTPGGYSLFGRDPPNLLLTAFGLMELSDMDTVYDVDPSTLSEMRSFVRSRQTADGSWGSGGRLEYPLGVSGDRLDATAYVTWALAHSGAEGTSVGRGADYVADRLDVADAGTTTLAVALNALAEADSHARLRGRIADELAERAVVDGASARWERTGESTYNYGDRRVLTTSMVTLGLLKSGERPGLVDGALTWIVEQKHGDGGWGGTQNTVMALKALVAGQSTTGTAPTGTITVTHDGEQVAGHEITATNRDEVRTFVLPAGAGSNEYAVTGPGEGTLYFEQRTDYHVPWAVAGGEGQLSLDVAYNRTALRTGETLAADVTLGNAGPTVGTALVTLPVPPGFAPDTAALDRLVDRGIASRYDVRGEGVVLYVEDLRGRESFAYRLRATTAGRVASGTAEVYDYYSPDTRATDAPVTLRVRSGDATGG